MIEKDRDQRMSTLGEAISPAMFAPKPGELGIVRDLGFNNVLRVGGKSEEEIFFVGPGGERAEHCNEEAAREFIAHYERHIETMKLYLLNERNRKTHEWTARSIPEALAQAERARKGGQ